MKPTRGQRVAITDDERGLEMAMVNRELIESIAAENRDLRERMAWLEAVAELADGIFTGHLRHVDRVLARVERLLGG